VAELFSKEPVVVGYVMDTLPILCIYLFFDAIHGVQSGNVRALGRQFIASIILLACYYVAGLPIALLLGFKA
jgi:MATE family multidrug resistance protein